MRAKLEPHAYGSFAQSLNPHEFSRVHIHQLWVRVWLTNARVCYLVGSGPVNETPLAKALGQRDIFPSHGSSGGSHSRIQKVTGVGLPAEPSGDRHVADAFLDVDMVQRLLDVERKARSDGGLIENEKGPAARRSAHFDESLAISGRP